MLLSPSVSPEHPWHQPHLWPPWSFALWGMLFCGQAPAMFIYSRPFNQELFTYVPEAVLRRVVHWLGSQGWLISAAPSQPNHPQTDSTPPAPDGGYHHCHFGNFAWQHILKLQSFLTACRFFSLKFISTLCCCKLKMGIKFEALLSTIYHLRISVEMLPRSDWKERRRFSIRARIESQLETWAKIIITMRIFTCFYGHSKFHLFLFGQ